MINPTDTMKQWHIFISLAALLLLAGCSGQHSTLQGELETLVADFPAEVGIALISDGDTVCVNGDAGFPLFSVVKFPQALAVAEMMRSNGMLQPCEPSHYDVKVTAEDLKPDTWSPMRDQHPDGGIFSAEQLMEYALVESDNNASDILFDHFASPQQVESFVKGWGIDGCGIAWTEDDQHDAPARCYDNWMTPLAAVCLLGRFYEARDRDERAQFVWQVMTRCQTGASRIPKYLAQQATAIVHKTGTGFILPDGTVSGINDIACIVCPDGQHFELAVFIKNAQCDAATCEEFMAQIAARCCTFLSERKSR